MQTRFRSFRFQNRETDVPKRSLRPVRWISRLIIGAGFGWLAILVVREASTIRELFRVINGMWVAGSFVAGAVYLLLAAMVFGILLSLHGQRPFRFIYVARLLFVGQMLRHIPGRLWGVVYLINETRRDVPPVVMLRANVDFMALTLVFHMLMSLTLYLFFYVGFWKSLVCPLFGLYGVVLAFRRDCIGACLSLIARWFPTRWLPEKLSGIAEGMQETKPMGWTDASKIVLLLITMGSVYLLGWYALARSLPELEHSTIWALCAAYSIAWISGYLSIVTPSGVGVREAVFMMLGSNVMELPSVALLSVFIRLWQIVLELALFLIFFFQKPLPDPGGALDHVID